MSDLSPGSQKITFEYLNFTIWASGPEVFSFSILGKYLKARVV